MIENRVQTLERSLDILEELSRANESLGVTQIGKRVDLSKSTVHRILQTLTMRGYVEKDKEDYRLGLKIIELASTRLNDLDIRKLAAPILEKAATMLEEAVHLVLLDNGEVVYIDTKVSSQKTINMFSRVGRRAPMHATAVGKAMLAFLPEEKARHILITKGLPKRTDSTITDINVLFKHLQEIRLNKFAYDDEENEVGIFCVGTPIFDYSGVVLGGVSVSGPATRMREKGLEEIAVTIRNVGEEISSRMGFISKK